MTLLMPSILDSQQYRFKALREMWDTPLVQSGVVAKTDFVITPKGSQPPMGVTVAAGEAWIRSTSVARNGAYHVINDAAVDVLLSAADATNPRIDRIVLAIADTSDLGSVTDGATLTAVPGTPTSGATLANLNGVAAAPADSLTLGYVLVAAGATSVNAAAIGCLTDPYWVTVGFSSPTAQSGAPPPYAFGCPAGRPPEVLAYNNTTQSIAHNTATAMAMNAERMDSDALHDNVTTNSQLKVPVPGLYQITGSVEFAANATGIRTTELMLQGSVVLARDIRAAMASGVTAVNINRLYRLNWGHYIEVRVTQTSGGALNIGNAGLNSAAEAGLVWVAP